MKVTIAFANISGGREFLGSIYGESDFGEVVLDKYIEAISSCNPDVVSLAEVHLEDDSHSEMVQYLSEQLQLPYFDILGSDKSHLADNKILGNAVLSKYPIVKVDHFIVESPLIETIRPNGDHWVMHHKPAQTAFIQVANSVIGVTSLQYMPFHHFNRKMSEPEFTPQRQSLVDHLTQNRTSTVEIITGDFNNKDQGLTEAFPELFEHGFLEAIETKSTITGIDQQLDHILYRKADGTVIDAGTIPIPSDHIGLWATIEIKD